MDDPKTALKTTPFSTSDMARGEDGELYHLPTLRALYAAGRLPFGSAGYAVLVSQGDRSVKRLIA